MHETRDSDIHRGWSTNPFVEWAELYFCMLMLPSYKPSTCRVHSEILKASIALQLTQKLPDEVSTARPPHQYWALPRYPWIDALQGHVDGMRRKSTARPGCGIWLSALRCLPFFEFLLSLLAMFLPYFQLFCSFLHQPSVFSALSRDISPSSCMLHTMFPGFSVCCLLFCIFPSTSPQSFLRLLNQFT